MAVFQITLTGNIDYPEVERALRSIDAAYSYSVEMVEPGVKDVIANPKRWEYWSIDPVTQKVVPAHTVL